MQTWKLPHIIKGMLTYVPVFNHWRQHRAFTGGTNDPRYCYSVWLRHLLNVLPFGFEVKGATVGELGPGDSIGAGLAALLSGAGSYIGLDAVPFSAKNRLEPLFDGLLQLFCRREPIPGDAEFPYVRPKLESYEFPTKLIDCDQIASRAQRIRRELQTGVNSGPLIRYQAPWRSADDVAPNSLDFIFSQAVLEYVRVEEAYNAMFRWLKPGAHATHTIDFSAHDFSPFWNGHWAYSDREWRIVWGRREYLLNREPFSGHIACARKAGFEILSVKPAYISGGLDLNALASPYQKLDPEDLRIRGAFMILRKSLEA